MTMLSNDDVKLYEHAQYTYEEEIRKRRVIMANQDSPVISPSILERAKDDAESLDWLSVPVDQRIIDDDLLDWICSTSTIIEEVVGLENKENQDLAPAKRIKLSIPSCQSSKESQRFEKISGGPEFASSSKGLFHATQKPGNTQWAVRMFNSWMEWRNIADPVPEAILSSDDAQALNKCLF